MRMSENSRKLLTKWEGIKLTAYYDAAGLPTIGVGHLITRQERRDQVIEIDGQQVAYGAGLTYKQGIRLLAQDLIRFEEAVTDYVVVELTQSQFDALVSFAFNVGINAFRRSALLRILNQGEYGAIPAQLRRWNRAGGGIIPGLVNRREKEIALWLSGNGENT